MEKMTPKKIIDSIFYLYTSVHYCTARHSLIVHFKVQGCREAMLTKKKNVEEEKMVLIGRMGTNLKCGIVGLPNVGKSTFFNVLTKTRY